MASLFMRSLLSPLKLAPSSYSNVQVLLSPRITTKEASADRSQAKSPYLTEKDLSTLVDQCPSLSSSFNPSPQLPSGHLQTIYSTMADTVDIDVVHYVRRVIMLPDGGIVSLDICDNAERSGDTNCPTVVIAHGLTGGSQESYVRHCIKRLAEPVAQGGPGYRCVVVNFRGCAGTPVTSAQLYSAAKTSDLRSAILFLQKLYPSSPLVGVGFSLGANVMAKYLGEEGDNTPLLGGIVCAAPFDLKKGSDLMENNTLRRQVYSRAMNANLKGVAGRHAATLALNEEMRAGLDLLFDDDLGQAHVKRRGDGAGNSIKTLKYADDCIVRLVGGHREPYDRFPFATADDYYNFGGALNFLRGLKRPMLALNADDDPIVAADSIAGIRQLMGLHHAKKSDGTEPDYGSTDFIVLATTQGGGHLGWWEGIRKPTRWLGTPVKEFCKALFSLSSQKLQGQELTSYCEAHRTQTDEKEVLVELMPAQLLPPYRKPKERAANPAPDVQKVMRDDPVHQRGARLPWLRTQLLEHPKLLHPSMAEQGWRGERPLDEADFQVDAQGSLSSTQDHDKAKGWCAFNATMVVDTKRPEVGYLELPAWTRVAGAGEHFQGGKQTPGSYKDEEGNKDGKGNTMIAGL